MIPPDPRTPPEALLAADGGEDAVLYCPLHLLRLDPHRVGRFLPPTEVRRVRVRVEVVDSVPIQPAGDHVEPDADARSAGIEAQLGYVTGGD